jgi:hypothetical protein
VDGAWLVYVPAGEFLMGGGEPEQSEHTVTLSAFWIYGTEVTNRMYARCVAMGDCSPPADGASYPDYLDPAIDDHPVVGVDWKQAEAYCQVVGGHLPSEAQWEKTARGPDGKPYPWGKGEPKCHLLNFDDCVQGRSDVGEYREGRSYYQALDMAGNVYEWVLDWYERGYHQHAPAKDPMGPESGQVRSVRGSGFGTEAELVPTALRFYLEPDRFRADLGFRCVVADPYKYAPPCQVLAFVADLPSGGPVDPLNPDPTTCEVDPPDVGLVDYCEKKVRHLHVKYEPNSADVTYSSTASCTESPGQIDCWGMGSETIEYHICTSCQPVPACSILTQSAVCAPDYDLDTNTSWCRHTPDPTSGWECTSGMVFDPELICCKVATGAPDRYFVCPPGTTYESCSQTCIFDGILVPEETECINGSAAFDPCE